MIEYFKKVYIKTIDDFPKEKGDYFCCRSGFMTVQRLDSSLPAKSYQREIKWYLLPIEQKPDCYPKEFVEWILGNVHFDSTYMGYMAFDVLKVFNSIDELFIYWQTNIKEK